jgi:hypothetical protein
MVPSTRYSLSFLAVFFALLFSSCESTPSDNNNDPGKSESKAAEAYAEMENVFAAPGSIEEKDFSRAENLYREALAADPSNPSANFGAAFTRILGVFADTAIKNSVKRWEGFDPESPSMLKFGLPAGTGDMTVPTAALSKNLFKIIRAAQSDPPTITEMQTMIKNHLLPRVEYAIARMAVVEQHPAFEMRISGKMQGRPTATDVYLDMTEVYIMDAMLHGMKATIEQFLVFRFDLDRYNTRSIVAALQPTNATFFVLAPDGAARAQSIKSSLLSAVGKIRSGVNFLKSETDNQDNDIIKKGAGGIAQNDLDTVLVYLNKIESALTGVFTVELKDADSDGNDYTIQVSLNNFFSNLPQNPKQAWFPAYTIDTTAHGSILWRWQAQNYATFTFPDPTFSGLFPGMSNETLKRILYIDEAFSWRVDVNLTDYNWPPSAQTVKLIINGKEYLPKKSSWFGQFEFYVADNNGQPIQSIVAVNNGVNIPLSFIGNIPVVRLKESDDITADISPAPQNITAEYNSGQNSILINFQQYSWYRIERSVSNGAFVKIDSVSTYYYSDNNIVPATNYRYRALKGPSYYNYWGYMAIRTNNYTNTVSITTP